nr:hypothetical protein CFP56_57625 [Quercus suber]
MMARVSEETCFMQGSCSSGCSSDGKDVKRSTNPRIGGTTGVARTQGTPDDSETPEREESPCLSSLYLSPFHRTPEPSCSPAPESTVSQVCMGKRSTFDGKFSMTDFILERWRAENGRSHFEADVVIISVRLGNARSKRVKQTLAAAPSSIVDKMEAETRQSLSSGSRLLHSLDTTHGVTTNGTSSSSCHPCRPEVHQYVSKITTR